MAEHAGAVVPVGKRIMEMMPGTSPCFNNVQQGSPTPALYKSCLVIQEVSRLKAENADALETKKLLENQMIAASNKLEGMSQASCCISHFPPS